VGAGIELSLRADDHARARLVEPEKRALALQDLGQEVDPARVGAPAADRRPRAALDQREREAAGAILSVRSGAII
jgi:hypothetical protein